MSKTTYELEKRISNFVKNLIPHSMLLKPLSKKIDWIAQEVAKISEWYVEVKIKECSKE